jgi:hypothetical protein
VTPVNVPDRVSAGSSGCEQGPVTPGDEALLVARPAHQASRQVGIRSCETEAAGITPRPQARDEVGVSSATGPRPRARVEGTPR